MSRVWRGSAPSTRASIAGALALVVCLLPAIARTVAPVQAVDGWDRAASGLWFELLDVPRPVRDLVLALAPRTDPWGHGWVFYESDEPRPAHSVGPDGRVGTADDIDLERLPDRARWGSALDWWALALAPTLAAPVALLCLTRSVGRGHAGRRALVTLLPVLLLGGSLWEPTDHACFTPPLRRLACEWVDALRIVPSDMAGDLAAWATCGLCAWLALFALDLGVSGTNDAAAGWPRRRGARRRRATRASARGRRGSSCRAGPP